MAKSALLTSHRLFIDTPLATGGEAALDKAQTNYLLNVLRLPDGAQILVFNGKDGEFRANLALADRKSAGRKSASLSIEARTRPQPPASKLHYYFAPLKHARLDYMAQKAVEMGVSMLAPVITQRTQATRVNLERLRANAIEAAEQCELLSLPEIVVERPLMQVLDAWPPDRLLIFCDENAPVADPVAVLRGAAARGYGASGAEHIAVLIGPEGGFDRAERAALLRLPAVLPLSLGPRILRADTAAVAALALVQAVLGDLRG